MRYRITLPHVVAFLMTVLAAGMIAAATLAPLAQAKTSDQPVGQKVYRIGFHLWKPGKIYDEAMAGIKDGLELAGIRYEEVILQSNKDKALAEENLQKLDAMGLDIIYSLSSAGTKIAKKLKLRTPVIATVINHPASLGVAQEGGNSATRLTGTSYYIDAATQLDLYRTLFPRATSVGMIYDAKNPAGYLAEEPFMKEACDALGFGFHSVGINQKTELEAATNQLIAAGVDMIVVPTNRLVYGNLDVVLEISHEHNVPVVSMNKQGVENGALAGLFADTYNLGRQTADMAKRILVDEANPLEMPYEYIPEPDVIVSLSSAERLNYEFPAEVLSGARIVLQ